MQLHPLLPQNLELPCGQYLDLLDRWNRTHALTALPSAARREELLLDASVLLPWVDSLPPGARIVDFGSGCGSPGVLLALSRPDVSVLPVDSAGKKIAFLRQVRAELGLENLEPTLGRIEALPCLAGDLGTAKALGPLAQLLAWWGRHRRSPEAPFLAFKGAGGNPEEAGEGWRLRLHPYELPTRGRRLLVEARALAGREGEGR